MPRWKGKTRGNRWGYMFFIALIKHFGTSTAYAFLYFVAGYFVIFARKPAKAIISYARKGLGYGAFKAWRLMCRNFYRMGQILIDKVAILNGMASRYNFLFENYEPLLQVLNSQSGVVLIGAHVGNWETGAPFFGEYGKKMHIVMYDAEYQAIKKVMEENRSIAGEYQVIAVNKDSLSHVFLISNALQRNEYVCFQGDRYVNEEKLLYADFLGNKAPFPAGPFVIASRMRVPVVFYFAMREKGRQYRFHFTIVEPRKYKRGEHGEQILLDAYVKYLEKIVKRYPEQWFNYYDFWEHPTIDDTAQKKNTESHENV